jgi:broad specificity phosphatase PhoE
MDNPTRLWLIRHAEVEERYHRTFGGRLDMELSPRGLQQATALANYLRRHRFHAIFSSPLKRASQTVALLGQYAGLEPSFSADLQEVDFGDWTGLRWEAVRERFQVDPYHWLDQLERGGIPRAEKPEALHDRVRAFLERTVANHPGQSVAVVCHGGVLRVFLATLLGFRLAQLGTVEIEYGSVTVLSHLPWRTELQLLNFTPWRDLT